MINSLYPSFQRWSAWGSVWVYGDPHFGDKEMQKHFGYPSDEEQIKNIRKVVGRNDTLIILGDVGDLKWIDQIRGYKVLLKGNHDTGKNKELRYLFEEVYDGPLFIGERILLSHEPIDVPFALNIHGHTHHGPRISLNEVNATANAIGFKPVNLGKLIKDGALANIPSLHRITIDNASQNKKEREHES